MNCCEGRGPVHDVPVRPSMRVTRRPTWNCEVSTPARARPTSSRRTVSLELIDEIDGGVAFPPGCSFADGDGEMRLDWAGSADEDDDNYARQNGGYRAPW